MIKYILAFAIFALSTSLTAQISTQTAGRIKTYTNLPGTCGSSSVAYQSSDTTFYKCAPANTWTAIGSGGAGDAPGYTTVAFSATPTFTATSTNSTQNARTFLITLTADVTSSTLSGAVTGQILTFRMCQDVSGLHTFVPPTNVLNMGTIDATASSCSQQTFVYDGTNAQALGLMFVTGPAGSAITFRGSTSGTTVVQPAAVASGTQTLPGATGTVGVITGSPSNNDCTKIVVSGSTYTLTTAGAACGAGGGGSTYTDFQAGVCEATTFKSDRIHLVAGTITGFCDGSNPDTTPALNLPASATAEMHIQQRLTASASAPTLKLQWYSASGSTTGNAKFSHKISCSGAGDIVNDFGAGNPLYGAPATTTTAVSASAYGLTLTTLSGATIPASCTNNSLMTISFSFLGADAATTMAGAVKLVHVQLTTP